MVSYSDALETVLHQAFDYAVRWQHPAISQDHLLLALLSDHHIKQVLQDCGLKTELFAQSFSNYIDTVQAPLRYLPNEEPAHSEALSNIFLRAIQAAKREQSRKITPIDILLSLLREPESNGVTMLSLTISARPAMEHLASPKLLERFIKDKSIELKRPALLRKIGKLLPTKKWSLTSPRFAAPPHFQDNDLPVINTLDELADWLLIPKAELRWFADITGIAANSVKENHRHYYGQWLAKKGKTPRLLEIPKTDMKELQRKILSDILNKIPPHPAAHGFVKKRSVITAAQAHASESVVIAMDFSEFFPRIRPAMIRAIFTAMGYPPPVALHLAGLCMTITQSEKFSQLPKAQRHSLDVQKLYLRPHLPQGAPTSPALANLASWHLDVRLAALCQNREANYSRYADDMAFSGSEKFLIHAHDFTRLIKHICAEEGFFIRQDKTRIMTQGHAQRLTGLVVNSHVNIGRKDYDRLKATLHNCIIRGAESQNREKIADFRNHLQGKVSWVENINLQKGQKLRLLFEKINWK